MGAAAGHPTPSPASVVQSRRSMPLRIETRVGKADCLLVLEGWLSGPEVLEFEAAASSQKPPLRIDLSRVAGADLDGAAALHVQRNRGAKLENAPRYIELLLETPPQNLR